MTKKLTLLIALFTITLTTFAQVNLRYDVNIGDEFTIAQRATQTITQDIPGMKQVIENDLRGTMSFKVQDVKKDTIVFNMNFKTFAIKMSSPQHGVMMNVDTSIEDDASSEHLMFKGMLNQPIIIKMLRTGKIAQVLNGEAVIEGMIDGLGVDDESMREQMYEQLSKEWSGDALAKSFEQMTYNYPNKTVKVGDTWKNNFKGDGKINADNTWKLDQINTDTAVISGQALITMDLTNPQIEMILKGTQQTAILSTIKSGFPKSIEVISTASGDATTPAMPGSVIPTRLESKTTYTLQ
ncbi:hypothetical protein EAX61_06130 [Dokdonia sinensis]|uniref:DUF4412 domain-containing protein n=1 Tax=Dokdonia sinensis TaxID=2479847 RepID=A0A3M0GEG3_9FLAO|nr:DUF6263 family protein [Dokdonia sinensis]RMB61052.1 hypothetical protein EAX61_06130 [Dokdonia sinensis]